MRREREPGAAHDPSPSRRGGAILETRLRLLIRILAVVLATAVAALMATLGLYLAGDSPLGTGISRWASRAGDGSARTAFWLAATLSAGAFAALVVGARTGRLRIAVAGVTVGGLAVAAATLTFAAFGAR